MKHMPAGDLKVSMADHLRRHRKDRHIRVNN
jgi:hypothetical protein